MICYCLCFQTPEVLRLEKVLRACGRGVMPVGRKVRVVFGERPTADDRIRIMKGLLENVGMEGNNLISIISFKPLTLFVLGVFNF